MKLYGSSPDYLLPYSLLLVSYPLFANRLEIFGVVKTQEVYYN